MFSLSPKILPPAGLSPGDLEQGHSLWHDAWIRLRKNKLAVAGGVVLIVLSLACALLPLVLDLSYNAQGNDVAGARPGARVVRIHVSSDDHSAFSVSDLPHLRLKPEYTSRPGYSEALLQLEQGKDVILDGRLHRPATYVLGGDVPHGRDLFARLLYGGRISITVGLVATLVALTIGVVYGAISGYAGGKVDAAMMRFVEIVAALPFTVFVILLMVWFGRDIYLLFVAIGAVEWLTMARIVRGQILTVKRMEFIEAARSLGLSTPRIIFRHMIPNILGPIIVYTTLTIPAVMLLEAFLSFLGLGVQPPMSSWGSLIKDGSEMMEEYPWLLIFPGAVFSLTLFSLNFLGDGLRDALDVRASKD